MCESNLNPQEIKQNFYKLVQQQYVNQYIKKPFIDEDKLLFLIEMFRTINISKEEKQEIILTILLVQSALDIHEQIPINNDESTMTETARQLSVLSGDYYSSLYYFILSRLEHVDMIHMLANAIRNINIVKMNLYDHHIENYEALIPLIIKIDTLLITKVASYFEIDSVFIEVIEKSCLINYLEKELKLLQSNKSTPFQSFLKGKLGRTNSADKMELVGIEIEKQKLALEEKISLLPYTHRHFHTVILDKYQLSKHIILAEEG